MKTLFGSLLACALLVSSFNGVDAPPATDAANGKADSPIFGFRDAAAERTIEARFLLVPSAKRAEEHLRTLTKVPHIAGSPEDKATAEYVASKFRQAGLQTEIVEYKGWFNLPAEIRVDVTAPPGVSMHGPTREHVEGDPSQDDPRVVMPYSGMSPSGDVEADVVFANYG